MRHHPIRASALLVAASALAVTACTSAESGSDGAPTSSTDSTATTEAEPLTVTASTFEVTYRLDGMTAASSAVGTDIPAGTTLVGAPRANSTVRAGEAIGTLRAAPAEAAEDNGTVARSQRALAASRAGTITAPASGVLTSTSTGVRIADRGLDVVVPLKPLQELRYRALRFSGQASTETVLGQRRSPCVATWIEQMPLSDAAGADGDTGATTAQVRCRLAPSIETAPGLPAVLTLSSPPQQDVVAIPVIYIAPDESGKNYVVRLKKGDDVIERRVVVGATDGVRRVVTSGLAPGDIILPAAPR